jgi:hypothetical protein
VNRRHIAIGVSSVSGLAVVAAGAMSLLGSGSSAKAVDLHAAPVAAVSGAAGITGLAGTAQVDTVETVVSPALPAHGRTPATPAGTVSMHGSGQVDFDRQAVAIDLTVPNGTLNEVLTPTMVYLRRAATAATPATGTTPAAAAVPASPWTSMATAKTADGDLVSGGAIEPALVFALLGGVQSGAHEVGQDVVRGVPVAHYQGTIDLGQAMAALNGPASARSAGAADAAAEKQALANASRAFTTTSVPFDAYLDGQGRLRRFVASFAFVADLGTKQVDQVTSATELYGFGTPATVVIPKGAVPAGGGAGAVPGTENSPARRSTTPSAHPTSPSRAHK